ncbi:MAG: nucleotide pyrophosphohydrolase [Candidatus Moranbacteria bacterium CG_4_8_14_3_um_filter_34_16]|nr:MAG: nucleotide pyrophosphohydrolase [Candidatus Moranbacteria bacterium CG08_land_8_20_14_0_20_34_16]PIW95098.1 MAG: nucleotide pyrophosphohydrolase [Candidatus Moranbacteria bacterium CG_4_8_14_3_um_filter_34_16]
MDIKQAQEKIKDLFGEMEHPRLASFIALTEEVGEVANEVMKCEIYEEKNNTDDLKIEIADVFVCILELANVYNFDLSSEFEKKVSHLEPRAKEWKLKLKDLLEKKRNKLD